MSKTYTEDQKAGSANKYYVIMYGSNQSVHLGGIENH